MCGILAFNPRDLFSEMVRLLFGWDPVFFIKSLPILKLQPLG